MKVTSLFYIFPYFIIIIYLSPNREGRWGSTENFPTSFLQFSLFSTALWDLANSRPVHSLMLSSHLILCLPILLPPFTVPCISVHEIQRTPVKSAGPSQTSVKCHKVPDKISPDLRFKTGENYRSPSRVIYITDAVT